MKFLIEKPSIVAEAQKTKFRPNMIIQALIFVAVFLVSQIAEVIITIIISTIYYIYYYSHNSINLADSSQIINTGIKLANSSITVLFTLFGTLGAIIIIAVYCKFIEKRSLYSMGFVKKAALSDYLKGMLIGLVMFSAAVLICLITGTLNYNGITASGNVGFIILFFIGFLIQGMSEEVLCRGYMLITISAKKTMLAGILINSVVFGALHLFNSGVTVLSIVNIILIGIFFSVYMLKSDSIWGVAAMHSVWNFVQGNFFGIKVSGMDMGASVFQFTSTADGGLINGGAFGLEGGLAVTIVEIIAIALVLLWKGKKSEKAIDKEQINFEPVVLIEQ